MGLRSYDTSDVVGDVSIAFSFSVLYVEYGITLACAPVSTLALRVLLLILVSI